jgi:hypothetical protein
MGLFELHAMNGSLAKLCNMRKSLALAKFLPF